MRNEPEGESGQKFRSDPYGRSAGVVLSPSLSGIDFMSLWTVALILIPNKTDNKRGLSYPQSLTRDCTTRVGCVLVCAWRKRGSAALCRGGKTQAPHSYVKDGLL